MRTMKKTIITFGLFLIYVAAYGGLISLINHLLRTYGYSSHNTTAVLVASTIFVYYKCWIWLCRKLNLIEVEYGNSKDSDIENNIRNKNKRESKISIWHICILAGLACAVLGMFLLIRA